jgi:hypothetical protein
MANNRNHEELKQQALRSLAEGRGEISAEVRRLRRHLSPARVLRRVVDRHTVLVVLLAISAGIVPAVLVFRDRRSDDRKRAPVVVSVPRPPPKSVLGALLLGTLGVLARTITPALVKSAIKFQISRTGRTSPASRDVAAG